MRKHLSAVLLDDEGFRQCSSSVAALQYLQELTIKMRLEIKCKAPIFSPKFSLSAVELVRRSSKDHDFQEVNFLLNKSLVELLIVLSISLSCLPRFVKKQGDLLAN
ncbi:hypothetical protein QYF36_004409 [Acer negundo]|nr:hypothetical protein QYF36_004409 [Acer negundo]